MQCLQLSQLVIEEYFSSEYRYGQGDRNVLPTLTVYSSLFKLQMSEVSENTHIPALSVFICLFTWCFTPPLTLFQLYMYIYIYIFILIFMVLFCC